MDVEAKILQLVGRRSGTVCPSEVARALSDDWRPLMPVVREAAARLVTEGKVEVTQGGEVVDLATARGPIRIRQAR